MGDADLEALAALLESSSRFRVLRRLAEPVPAPMPADLFRRGLFVDVETTGLDAGKDTVIELAMVPFGYERYSDRMLSDFEKVGDRVGSLSARSGKAHHGTGLQASDLSCRKQLP
ncbi:hypothetical protein [Bradyrhizobium centrosematis]|uniref:hypothetical protein n=1 Tax=Bradyrhizobium centrosematis TaxID=1300039 RepID=UPI002168AFC7|nr:hypothetical protein [Bradyrhizobium centrosematis]MCS3758676.1 hypothetical protein [Bradyrhizobium centrosematis]MCS3773436.1 hypothetical protein [Bradyrhizobium centrosematis]